MRLAREPPACREVKPAAGENEKRQLARLLGEAPKYDSKTHPIDYLRQLLQWGKPGANLAACVSKVTVGVQMRGYVDLPALYAAGCYPHAWAAPLAADAVEAANSQMAASPEAADPQALAEAAIRMGLPPRERHQAQQQQQQQAQAQRQQSGQPSKQRWHAGQAMRGSGGSGAAASGSATQGTRGTVDQQVQQQVQQQQQQQQQEAQPPPEGRHQDHQQQQAQQQPPSSRPSSGGRRPAAAARGGGTGQQAGDSTAVAAQVQEPAGIAASLPGDGGTEVWRRLTATACGAASRLGLDGAPPVSLRGLSCIAPCAPASQREFARASLQHCSTAALPS